MLSLRPRAFVYEVVVFWPGASGERVHMTVMRLPPNITRTGTHVELAVMSKTISEHPFAGWFTFVWSGHTQHVRKAKMSCNITCDHLGNSILYRISKRLLYS